MITLTELQQIESAAGWTSEDAKWLGIAAEALIPQAEKMVDSWRSLIASQPYLAASFLTPEGEPDEHYKAAVRSRFVRWVSDICLKPHDQEWLDYQNEIGLRHTPAKKNLTDGCNTSPIVPQRFLIGFSAVVITTIRSFLLPTGRPAHEIDRMQEAWTRAILLSIALWSRPYVREGYW